MSNCIDLWVTDSTMRFNSRKAVASSESRNLNTSLNDDDQFFLVIEMICWATCCCGCIWIPCQKLHGKSCLVQEEELKTLFKESYAIECVRTLYPGTKNEKNLH